jgi:hypothetical protein
MISKCPPLVILHSVLEPSYLRVGFLLAVEALDQNSRTYNLGDHHEQTRDVNL